MKFLLLAVLFITGCGVEADDHDHGDPVHDHPECGHPHSEEVECPETDNPGGGVSIPIEDQLPPNPTKEISSLIVLNGTTAKCWHYQPVINYATGVKIKVTCPESPNTGSGYDGLNAFKKLYKQHPNIVHVVVSGHSQGGVGAVATAYLIQQEFPKLRVDTLAIQPAFSMNPKFYEYAKNLKGKKVVMCGTLDSIVPCSGVWAGYAHIKEPKEFVTTVTGHFNPHRQWIKLLGRFDWGKG
ncbi:MAG: hypothetical protein E2O82_03630 [Betaproteobacteria bacterium]|nr:MAG: hypothetical protein E2O82_03630 [Betaproteobacteria bacterium]